MFRRSPEAQAKRAENRAALEARYQASQDERKKAKLAKEAARAEKLAGSLFASTPCYDSLWTYAVVFPDRIEERKKDDTIAKVRFLRDITGVQQSAAMVELTGSGWSETFYCKGREEAQRMIEVVTSLLSNGGRLDRP
jgi:hypothetical protein